MSSGPDEMRRNIRAALERGGLIFKPSRHNAQLSARFGVSAPVSEHIQRLLQGRDAPADPNELSFFRNIPAMTGFACTAIDCVYELAAHERRLRGQVRLCYSLFITASAALDYLYDEGRSSENTFGNRWDTKALRRALIEGEVPRISRADDGGLTRYAAVLIEEELRVCHGLLSASSTNRNDVRAELVDTMVRLYEAEILASPGVRDHLSGDLARSVVWTNSAWLACLLVGLTSDAKPDLDYDWLRDHATRVGRLFFLIDGLLDVEDDYQSGVPNSFLSGVEGLSGRPRSAGLPWGAILASSASQAAVDEIATLVSQVTHPAYEEDLTAWLYSWVR